MEFETSAKSGDSLIIADKPKEDSCIAQKIQEECDKKFNNNDISSKEQPEDFVEVDFDVNEEEAQRMHNGNNNQDQEKGKEVDVQLDSLNISNDEHQDDDVKEEKVDEIILQNGESKEKPIESLEMQETKEEIVEIVGTQHEEKTKENDIEVVENGNNHEETVRSASPVIINEVCKLEQPAAKPREIIPSENTRAMPIIDNESIVQKEPLATGPRKGAIATSMDTESVREAYNDIRADNSKTQWAVFKYEASRIVCSSKGVSFDEFKEQFAEDERAYGYIRLQTGDEMSKRHKFLFVTWIGPGVSVLKRAKVSTDKAIIKNVVCNFAVELQLETLTEFDLPFFIESLNKASGANYGTGVREI